MGERSAASALMAHRKGARGTLGKRSAAREESDGPPKGLGDTWGSAQLRARGERWPTRKGLGGGYRFGSLLCAHTHRGDYLEIGVTIRIRQCVWLLAVNATGLDSAVGAAEPTSGLGVSRVCTITVPSDTIRNLQRYEFLRCLRHPSGVSMDRPARLS